LASNPSFKSYESSEKAYRSFCSNCGSSIAFNDREMPERTEIYPGTLDEDVLCGKRVEGTNKREGGLGLQVVKAERHMYMENAISGVTDGTVDYLAGLKYATSRSGSKPYE